MTETMRAPTIETYRFADDGIVPNNPALPLVVYREALPASGDRASACERMFAEHGWPDSWRNGIYGHHHYHSTAHEVLGIARGNARVRLGGVGGLAAIAERAGDVRDVVPGVGDIAGGTHRVRVERVGDPVAAQPFGGAVIVCGHHRIGLRAIKECGGAIRREAFDPGRSDAT